MRNKLLYAIESSAGFELSWGIHQPLDGLETQTRSCVFCHSNQILNDQNEQTVCLLWMYSDLQVLGHKKTKQMQKDCLKLWHGQRYAQFYFYFKKSNLVNNAFIISKQHQGKASIDQKHYRWTGMSGCLRYWGNRMAAQSLLVDFPWFCIAYIEVDVLRQFHFTILTALSQ